MRGQGWEPLLAIPLDPDSMAGRLIYFVEKPHQEEKMSRRLVSSGSPYEPTIGFSRAVRVGAWISVSGTAPIGPNRETVGPGSASSQARRCFEIIGAALEEAGASLSDIVRTRIYLTDIADWEEVAEVHGQFLGEVRPAHGYSLQR